MKRSAKTAAAKNPAIRKNSPIGVRFCRGLLGSRGLSAGDGRPNRYELLIDASPLRQQDCLLLAQGLDGLTHGLRS